MYIYDQYDHQMLKDRIAQFRDQTRRFLSGDLTNEQFLPLRLQNGLYIQRLAPMLSLAKSTTASSRYCLLFFSMKARKPVYS